MFILKVANSRLSITYNGVESFHPFTFSSFGDDFRVASTGFGEILIGQYDDFLDGDNSNTPYPNATALRNHLSKYASTNFNTASGGSGAGELLAANNLSDVDNPVTSFNNIKQAASETATGVIELATQEETNAGLDLSRGITPKKLNDYKKFRTNHVLVKSLADLPDPVGNQIPGEADTAYELNGLIALPANGIKLGSNSIIYGANPFKDGFTHTGGGAMITAVNSDFVIDNITLSSTTGDILDIIGDGTNKFKITGTIFNGGAALGENKGGFLYQIIEGSLFVGLSNGLIYSGNSNDVFIFDNFFAAFTGTATLIKINNNASYHTIFITRNMFESVVNQTILDIALGLTLVGGGLIAENSFEGAGDYLIGIDASSIGWRIPPQSNIGLPGLVFVEPKVNADGPYSTTSFSFGQVPEDIPILGFGDYQPNGSKMAAVQKADLTHDQSGQVVCIDVYDTINANELGFGGAVKLDVNTIVWQSGNTIRYTFNGAPDLSQAIVKDIMHVDSATNASNNGSFIIVAVDNTAKWIEIVNPSRTDATDDEAADSPAESWGGSVWYQTITTGGVYETIEIPRFHGIVENSNLRVRIRKVTSGGGNPTVYVDNGIIRLFNY